MAKATWKTKLEKLSALQGQSGEIAYQRTKLAVELFEDSDFRDGIHASDDDQCIEFLDDQFKDFRLFANFRVSPFLKLRQIYKRFPKAADWASGDLAALYDVVAAEVKQLPEDEEEDTKARRRVTKAEFEEMQEERDDYAAQVRNLQEQLSEAQAALRELRQENATLKGRIQELERMVERRMQVA